MEHSTITEIRSKEVICAKNGVRIGFVSDVEFDLKSGQLTALIIFGKTRFGGLLGREGDLRIPWAEVQVIGDDTILVQTALSDRPAPNGKRSGLETWLSR